MKFKSDSGQNGGSINFHIDNDGKASLLNLSGIFANATSLSQQNQILNALDKGLE